MCYKPVEKKIKLQGGEPLGLFKTLFGTGEPETIPKLKRNDICWCGSGKKYKKCHMAADDKKRSRQIAKTCATGS